MEEPGNVENNLEPYATKGTPLQQEGEENDSVETVRVPEIAKIKPRVDRAWKSQCTDGKAAAKMTMADNASMCIVGAKYGGKQEKEATLNEAAEVIVATEEGYLEIAAQEEAENSNNIQ